MSYVKGSVDLNKSLHFLGAVTAGAASSVVAAFGKVVVLAPQAAATFGAQVVTFYGIQEVLRHALVNTDRVKTVLIPFTQNHPRLNQLGTYSFKLAEVGLALGAATYLNAQFTYALALRQIVVLGAIALAPIPAPDFVSVAIKTVKGIYINLQKKFSGVPGIAKELSQPISLDRLANLLTKDGKFIDNDHTTAICKAIMKKLDQESTITDLESKVSDGMLPENISKNRYSQSVNLPLNTNRIQGPNLGYIPGTKIEIKIDETTTDPFLVTQGPKNAEVMKDYWMMIHTLDVEMGVNLTMDVENGKEKCFNYWEIEEEVEFATGLFVKKTMTEAFTEPMEGQDPDPTEQTIMIYTFTIRDRTNNQVEKEFRLYHHQNIPDQGVPHLGQFDALIQNVDRNKKYGDPLWIHCSAGEGRSGLFLLDLLVARKLSESPDKPIDIYQMLLDLRKQRMGMVSSAEQLKAAFEYVLAKGGKIEFPEVNTTG